MRMDTRSVLSCARVRDVRGRAAALVAGAVVIGGLIVAGLPGADSGASQRAHAQEKRSAEIETRFAQGVAMLHAKQHEHALTAFHRVLELAPDMPEAHVNMGYALLGLERHAAARDFFESAIALRKGQLNAYYGLAVALEHLHDLAGAVGAMRTFIHLSRTDDPFRRKAQSALWEWESALSRERARPLAGAQ